MKTYVIKRVLLLIPTALIVLTAIFSMIRLAPGDIVSRIMAEGVSPGGGRNKDAEVLRHQLGLDQPAVKQYAGYVTGLLKGDLGKSLTDDKPVMEKMWARIPITFELAMLATVISLLLAIPTGIVSAVKQDSPLDYILRIIAISFLSAPTFWVGTLLVVYPALIWRFIPPLGYIPIWQNPVHNLAQFILPALALGIQQAGTVARMMRSSLLEVVRQDYIRTARSKGLRDRMVILRHALKNALIPVVSILGIQIAALLGGTVIVETIFALPGLGGLIVSSANNRDYPMLQGAVLFFAVVVVLLNLLTDISYGWLDPRVKYH